MPGLQDRYVIQFTVQELENLIQRIEYSGGIAFKQDIFDGDYNSLSNTPDLSIYAKKTDIPTNNFITFSQLDIRSEEIKNNLIGTNSDTEISNTIKGAVNAAQNFANDALTKAKEYCLQQIASDKLPKATTKQFGVVKIGQGLRINDTGTLIATGEGVTADSIEWNNVINKPQADDIKNDQYYLTLIDTLGAVALSNDYNDLNNKPDQVSKENIGLGNVDNVKQYSISNPPPYPVKSVNGRTGVVAVRELPSVTASDNGKFLRVVSEAWTAVEITNANGGSF